MRPVFSVHLLVAILISASSTLSAEDYPDEWWDSVKEVNEFTAVSQEGRLKLTVALIDPEPVVEKMVKGPNGDFPRHEYQGKLLPLDFYPGRKLLTKFELRWDGKLIPVEERFWNDLAGFEVEISTVDPKSIPIENRWRFKHEFSLQMLQPRIILSAEGGTVLIEWVKREDGDSQSTTRWIVTKSGTVLRHRDWPSWEDEDL